MRCMGHVQGLEFRGRGKKEGQCEGTGVLGKGRHSGHKML